MWIQLRVSNSSAVANNLPLIGAHVKSVIYNYNCHVYSNGPHTKSSTEVSKA